MSRKYNMSPFKYALLYDMREEDYPGKNEKIINETSTFLE